MLILTQREKIALLFLSISLVIGSVLTVVERRNPDTLEDFHIAGPEQSGSSGGEDESQGATDHNDYTLKLDINSATVDEFQVLPRIGPKIAERIVRWRELHGPFSSVKDLIKVEGIGEKTLAQIEPSIEVKSTYERGKSIKGEK